MNIKDAALAYQPKTAKNISDLQSVPVELVMMKEEGEYEGEKYAYNYVELSGEKYRIPDSVLKDLKAILSKKPTLKNFSVMKAGEGRNTKYTVIPMD